MEKKKAEQLELFTRSQVPVKELYTSADLPAGDSSEWLGSPAKYPFTRGVQKHIYRGLPWTNPQYSGF